MKIFLSAVLVMLILSYAAGLVNADAGPGNRAGINGDTTNQLRDGMYLVISQFKNQADVPDILAPDEVLVKCSDMLIENNEGEYTKMLVESSDFVPLKLRIKPVVGQQTETKKKIEIELTKSASDKLESFTNKNLNKRIALIIGGEVISAHKIKAPIKGGRFQISYCGPDMCEILESRLIENVDSSESK